MTLSRCHGIALLAAWAAVAVPIARAQTPGAPESASPTALSRLVDRAAQRALDTFHDEHLMASQLAITLVDLSNPTRPERASFRGDVPIYPASVIKLFYLAATHRWLEDGKLADTPELRRALYDMIVDSSNDATSYVVDMLTGTTRIRPL